MRRVRVRALHAGRRQVPRVRPRGARRGALVNHAVRGGVQSGTRVRDAAALTDIRNVRYFGTVNQDRTERVLGELLWHKSLASATRSARLASRPIVLFQALGDLRGLC